MKKILLPILLLVLLLGCNVTNSNITTLIEENKTDELQKLLSDDKNDYTKKSYTINPLIQAINKDNVTILEMLLNYGFTFSGDYTGMGNDNPLIYSLENEKYETAAFIFDKLDEIPIPVKLLSDEIYKKYNDKIIRALCTRKSYIETYKITQSGSENYVHFPLWLASEGREQDLGLFLINHQNYNIVDNFGRDIYHYAAEYTSPFILKKLENIGYDKEIKNKYGDTPLYSAIKGGKIENINFLIDNGADIFSSNKDNNSSVIHLLLSSMCKIPNDEKVKIVKILHTKGFDLNKVSYDYESECFGTPLMLAAWNLNFEVVKYLLENKVNKDIIYKIPNDTNESLYHPLFVGTWFDGNNVYNILDYKISNYDNYYSEEEVDMARTIRNYILNYDNLIYEEKDRILGTYTTEKDFYGLFKHLNLRVFREGKDFGFELSHNIDNKNYLITRFLLLSDDLLVQNDKIKINKEFSYYAPGQDLTLNFDITFNLNDLSLSEIFYINEYYHSEYKSNVSTLEKINTDDILLEKPDDNLIPKELYNVSSSYSISFKDTLIYPQLVKPSKNEIIKDQSLRISDNTFEFYGSDNGGSISVVIHNIGGKLIGGYLYSNKPDGDSEIININY